MAHIAVITSGLTGILNASFALVARLQAAGHSVTCASPAPVGERVLAEGLKYLQLAPTQFEPAPAIPPYRGPLKKVLRMLHKWQHAKSRQAQAVRNLDMPAFLNQMKVVRPDLVLIDVELHEHIMALYTSGFNTVLLSQWFSLWKRPGLPPIVTDIIPGVGQQGSERVIADRWQEIERQRTQMFAKKNGRSVGTDRRSVLLAYAKSVGFPLEYIKDNYWPGPFTYDELPVLSMTAQELEFPHDVRPNLTYVGPMVHADRAEGAIPERIDAFIAQGNAEGKKLIYCSVSTYRAGDASFLKKVIEAVDGQSGWLLIISLGGLMEADQFTNLPENVAAFAAVPQLHVLAHADLSINHGGIHTINECVHFGVSMLVYSGKRSDQNGCAARVQYHGIGRMADKDADAAADIRGNIAGLFADQALQQRVGAMTTTIKASAGKQVLEQAISMYLSKPTKATSSS